MNIDYQIRNRPISFSNPKTLSPSPHFHKEIEIIYVVSGGAVAYADRKQYQISDGDLFIAFPNQVHYFENSIKGEYYLTIFSPALLFETEQIMKAFLPENNVLNLGRNNVVETFLQNGLLSKNQEYATNIMGGYINLMMGMVIPKLSLKRITHSDDNTVQKIIKFCNQNFSGDVSLDMISDELHLNKYYVSHIINDKMGINLTNFINSLRINAACYMLREPKNKIADISENVGFGSIRTFNRVFREQMNVTPRDYRDAVLGVDK